MGRKSKDLNSFHGKTLLRNTQTRRTSCSAYNSVERAPRFPFQEFPTAATCKTTVQRTTGKKHRKGTHTTEELEEQEPPRISYCLLSREIKCCDVRHYKISTRQTSQVSPTTTQASQRSYLNPSMHQFL